MSAETLLSVGIDLGTTTTQLVFSRLTVRNEGSAFSVPNYTVAAREPLRGTFIRRRYGAGTDLICFRYESDTMKKRYKTVLIWI